jgi:regulatory protein
MAGTITGLKIQRRNKERVNVFLDDRYAFSVTVMTAAGLRKGQYLSNSEIEELKSDYERDKAYEHAIRFIGYRTRSRLEVVRRLHDKGYSSEVVMDTVERLQNEQYLDDEAFARFWLENREQFRPRGQQALRYELRQKGVVDEVIDTVLVDLDEDKLAWAAVESKLDHWKRLEEKEFKTKLIGYLSRRGFNYDITRNVIDRAWEMLNSSDPD